MNAVLNGVPIVSKMENFTASICSEAIAIYDSNSERICILYVNRYILKDAEENLISLWDDDVISIQGAFYRLPQEKMLKQQ